MASLDIDLDDYARGRTLQPIRRFRIGMMGQPAVENDHRDIVSYGIRRCEFDHFLLSRVRGPTQLGTAVKSLQRQGGNWVVNGQWAAPLLVGAGGHFCPVARLLGDGPGRHETVVAAKEVEFEMSPAQARACQARGDTPELWFCRDLKGYAWIFRKGNYLNIGLGREDNRKLGDHLEAFVEAMKQGGRIPPDLPGRFKGHAYLLYAHAKRPLVDDGVMLIGDSAGLAYTQSGEGIRRRWNRPCWRRRSFVRPVTTQRPHCRHTARPSPGASATGPASPNPAGSCRLGPERSGQRPDALALVHPQGSDGKVVPAPGRTAAGPGGVNTAWRTPNTKKAATGTASDC